MSNELLKFMNTTTSNIQEALGRSTKTKKVNHRKYLEKRLQNRGPRQVKNERKSKLTTTATTTSNVMYSRQPVAGLLPAPTAAQQSRSVSSFVKQSLPNEYDQLYSIVTSPPVFPGSANNSPPSAHGDGEVAAVASAAACCDPEIESLLSEFGVESPSQCSLYSETHSRATSSRGSLVGSLCGSSSTSLGSDPTMVTMTTGGTDWYAYSPPSDFSDFEDSLSPPNSSPAAGTTYYPPMVSPSPPVYYQQNLVASYDCIPAAGTAVSTLTEPLVIDSRPQHGLSLPYNPSISELIAELVSTP